MGRTTPVVRPQSPEGEAMGVLEQRIVGVATGRRRRAGPAGRFQRRMTPIPPAASRAPSTTSATLPRSRAFFKTAGMATAFAAWAALRREPRRAAPARQRLGDGKAIRHGCAHALPRRDGYAWFRARAARPAKSGLADEPRPSTTSNWLEISTATPGGADQPVPRINVLANEMKAREHVRQGSGITPPLARHLHARRAKPSRQG